MTTRPLRGEVWRVNFEPQVGSETKKARPAVVISEDSIGRLPLRIVVPITDWKAGYAKLPWFHQLNPTAENGLTKVSGADGFQVKSVSLERFSKRLGALTADETEGVAACVALCIGV